MRTAGQERKFVSAQLRSLERPLNSETCLMGYFRTSAKADLEHPTKFWQQLAGFLTFSR